MYYGLSWLDSWNVPFDSKWVPADITAGYDKVIIALQYINDLQDSYLTMHEQKTGVVDMVKLKRARAVDFASWAQDAANPTTVLWWGGREADTGADFELGVFGFRDP